MRNFLRRTTAGRIDSAATPADPSLPTPTPAELLLDIFGVLEDIREDMRAIRDGLDTLDPATVREDLRALRDRAELATDHLADARALAEG